jgi:hypothetical protein
MDSNQQPPPQPIQPQPAPIPPVPKSSNSHKKFIIFISIAVLLIIVALLYIFITAAAAPSTVTTETNSITTLLKSVETDLGIDKPILTGPQSHSWRVNGELVRTKGYYFDIYDSTDKLEKDVTEIDSYILAQGFVKNEENTVALNSQQYGPGGIFGTNEWESKGYEKGPLQCYTYTYIRIKGGYISFGCGGDLNQVQQQAEQPSPSLSIAPTVDTSKQVTYTNTEQGFSLQYPDNFKVDKEDKINYQTESAQRLLLHLNSTDPEVNKLQAKADNYFFGFSLTVYDQQQQQNCSSWVLEQESTKQISIGFQEATQTEGVTGYNTYLRAICFKTGKQIFTLEIEYPQDASLNIKEQHNKLFGQITSTFKLTQ